MPVRLHDFIRTAAPGEDSIAGYLEPGRASGDPPRFVHWRSSNAMLPAFVNCLEGGGDMRRIYTDHERAPWARPRGPGVKRRDNLRADEGDGSLMVEPVLATSRRWPARVAGSGGPAPLAGGLHAAALASTGPGTGDGRGGPDTPVPARSLRHYALAARTLIAASASCGFAGVHDHVGAILVDDTGAILAAGINTGSYRHAEVSLLLSWFRDHPEARTLPPKSIVLSTLTPCRQCTRYLSEARAPDTLIRFDEADAGRSGRVGERIAERLAERLDARTDAGTDAGTHAGSDRRTGSVPLPAGSGAVRESERRAIRNGGEGGRSRIDRARAARRAILDAAGVADPAGPVSGRASSRAEIRTENRVENGAAGRAAGRYAEATDRERADEAAVLAYLARWVLGAERIA